MGKLAKSYERVVREFADQQEAAGLARARLAAGAVAVGTGLTTRRVWTGPGVETSGFISPDGRYLSFTHWGNGDLAVRDLAAGRNELLTHLPDTDSGRVYWSRWSSDGKRLAYAFGAKGDDGPRELRVIDLDGSGMRTLYRNTGDGWTGPTTWSHDGKRILASNGESDFWIALAGGAQQRIRSGRLKFAWLSPDGKYIAFGDRSKNTEPWSLHLMASDGTGETKLSTNPTEEYPAGWSPDGKYLLFASHRTNTLGLWAMPMADGKPDGRPIMLQREIGYYLGVTRSGAFYHAVQTSISDIYSAPMDPTTGKVTASPIPLQVPRTGSNVLPTWSDDSRRIFYEFGPITAQNTVPSRQLFALSIDSGADDGIGIAIEGGSGAFCWAADGRSILKNSKHDKRRDLFRLAVTGESTRLAEYFSDAPFVSCSSDSKVLTYTDLMAAEVKVRNLGSGSETTIYRSESNRVFQGPVVSPDGNQVAFFVRAGDSSIALVVVPSAGGTTSELVRVKTPAKFQGYYGATWSPDGRYVYYLKAAGSTAPYELFRIPAAGGPEESAGLKAADLRDINISPDGTRIAFSIGAVRRPEVWAIENFLPPAK